MNPAVRPGTDPATALRRATWTLLGHGAFLLACAIVASLLRARLHASPPTLALAALVALLLFSRDVRRWLACRDAVQKSARARRADT